MADRTRPGTEGARKKDSRRGLPASDVGRLLAFPVVVVRGVTLAAVAVQVTAGVVPARARRRRGGQVAPGHEEQRHLRAKRGP